MSASGSLGRQWHPNVDEYISGGIGHMEGDQKRSVVGMVRTDRMERYREHDGMQNPHDPHHDRDVIDKIRSDIRGGKGITNPITLEYDHKAQWARIGEGNHRLAAAREEGVPYVPVRVYGRSHLSDEKGQGVGSHLEMTTNFDRPGSSGYVPPDIHPSHFRALRDD